MTRDVETIELSKRKDSLWEE